VCNLSGVTTARSGRAGSGTAVVKQAVGLSRPPPADAPQESLGRLPTAHQGKPLAPFPALRCNHGHAFGERRHILRPIAQRGEIVGPLRPSSRVRTRSVSTLLATCLLLAWPCLAWAHGAKWELREAVFIPCPPDIHVPCESGGEATGYVVLTDDLRPIDWAIHVSGSDQGGFEPFLYDPTTSTAHFVGGVPDIRPHLRISSPDGGLSGPVIRTLVLRLSGLPMSDTFFLGVDAAMPSREVRPRGGPIRQLSVSSKLTTNFAPVLTLKINLQHPGTRVVPTSGPVRLTLDVLPSGWTGAFSWYWAIIIGGQPYWITARGLSVIPTPFATQIPTAVTEAVLLDSLFPPGTYTNVLYLMEGSTLVSADWITAQVGR
jgi:hypothetical protein